jgi:hypothetical protein
MFDKLLNQETTDKPFIAPEEIALAHRQKEATNFIALTPAQKLNVLEALLVERVANNEYAEDAMQAIALLQPPAIKQPSTNRNIAHSFDIPILSEVGDILKMATVAGVLIGGALLVILAVNPRFCGEQNGSRFCSQVTATYKFFYNPKEN